MKRRTARPMRSVECIHQPIQKEDFQQLFELLRTETLREYIKRVCHLRMFILGFAAEDKLSADRLYDIIDELGQKDVYGKFRLPEDFEAARGILLRTREKQDFDRILEELEARSI